MNTKHGMNNTRIYRIWHGMRTRCNNKNDKGYRYYGGRGITVCDEWQGFVGFYEWVKTSNYKEGLDRPKQDRMSIERIDVNKGYCPDNCTWIPLKEQFKNKRKPCDAITVVVRGEELSLREISNKYEIKRTTIERRYHKGDRCERLIRALYIKRKRRATTTVTIRGKELSLIEVSAKYQVKLSTLWSRYRVGDRDEDLIRASKHKKLKQ